MSTEEESDTSETDETETETTEEVEETPKETPKYLTAEELTKVLDARDAAKEKKAPVKRTATPPTKKTAPKVVEKKVEEETPKPKRRGVSKSWFGSRADD